MSSVPTENINTTMAAGLIDEYKTDFPVDADPVICHEAPSETAIKDEEVATVANALEIDGTAVEHKEPQSIEIAGQPVVDSLSAELQRLVESVATVEELSRLAREAAVGDLAHYEAISASSEQYTAGLQQAPALEHDAAQALQSTGGSHSALAHNPNDTPALARILDTPPRGLRLVERAFRRKPVLLADLAESAHGRGGAAARRSVEELVSMLADIHAAAADRAPGGALELVLERTNYAVWLTNQQDGPERLQNLEHLHAILEHTSAPDLGTWLAELHLGETDAAPDQRCVSLLTVHATKGREWPVVFVTGVEEGLFAACSPAAFGAT